LTELAPAVVEAFAKDEIGVRHALLLAKLQPDQQEEALAACWQESLPHSRGFELFNCSSLRSCTETHPI
jgi:ParB family chromosome partitioning protein